MRTLRKTLCLVLAIVMVLGLCAFNVGATEFPDDESITHKEAVEVMNSLGIIEGRTTGNYDPQDTVTRGEMAKMITIIMQGTDAISAFLNTPTDLTDINGHWAEAYIKYCYSQGIISGFGDGTFRPNALVTTIQASKMLLVALGYNSEVRKYANDPSWEINVARDAQNKKLYDEVEDIISNQQLNRDDAAQMIYNTLTAKRVIEHQSINQKTGEVTLSYEDASFANNNVGSTLEETLLGDTFEGRIWLGIYAGNYDTDSTTTFKNAIHLERGALEANYNYTTSTGLATIYSDLGIENMGEQIKVIFKDSKNAGGQAQVPDTTDTIYGVYNTNALTVYNITRASIADNALGNNTQDQLANGKLKFNNAYYDVKDYSVNPTTGAALPTTTGRTVAVFDYNVTGAVSDTNVNAMTTTTIPFTPAVPVADGTGALTKGELARYFYTLRLNGDRSDRIKFICDTDGAIAEAVVVNLTLNKVTSATSTTVAVQGMGSQDYADGLVAYDGIAKDDVVVWYTVGTVGNGTNGHYVVEKAESVEGEISGYTNAPNGTPLFGAGAWQVTIAGTKYTIYNGKSVGVPTTITEDGMTNSGNGLVDEIGTNVVAYLVNGMVGAIQRASDTVYKYALVVDRNTATSGSIDNAKLQLLESDGTKTVYSIYKDSTYRVGNEFNKGDLVRYWVRSDGTIEVDAYIHAVSTTAANIYTGSTTGSNVGSGTNDNTQRTVKSHKLNATQNYAGKIWDKDSKVVRLSAAVSGVATQDCVMFVHTGAGTATSDYKAYKVRSLSNIDTTLAGKAVALVQNGDGEVVAAYVDLGAGVSSGTTNYGFVTAANGTVKIGDDEYYAFKVWNGAETVDVYQKVASVNAATFPQIAKNNYIAYGDVADNKFDNVADLYVLAVNGLVTANGVADVATKKWSTGDGTLTVYQSVNDTTLGVGAVRNYEGVNAQTIPMDDKVQVIYVNRETSAGVENFGVVEFSAVHGYANAKLVVNSDGKVEALFVETSDKCNINGLTGDAGVAGVSYTAGTYADTAIEAVLTTYKTVVVNGNLTLSNAALDIASGQTVIVNGNLLTGQAVNVAAGGKLTVTGSYSATNTLTNNGGTISIGVDANNLTHNAGTSTIGGTLTGLTTGANVDGGTVTANTITTFTNPQIATDKQLDVYGAVTTLTNVTGQSGTAAVVFHGAVGTAQTVTSGTVTFQGDVGTAAGTANGILTLAGGTVNIQANAYIPAPATPGGASVVLGASGKLYIGAPNSNNGGAYVMSGLTSITGSSGAQIILRYTSGTTNTITITTASGWLYKNATTAEDTYNSGAAVTASDKTYTHNGTHFVLG